MMCYKMRTSSRATNMRSPTRVPVDAARAGQLRFGRRFKEYTEDADDRGGAPAPKPAGLRETPHAARRDAALPARHFPVRLRRARDKNTIRAARVHVRLPVLGLPGLRDPPA